ncbi:AAA family ATPase [Rhizobium leguminosarum]|uniref:AAA family ATPase n=1 Tax=Rhizobium leguminosarum TaxID=384 RepID=UPI0010300D6C|nr:AAA family ATPase [Rhizobium leguminosarum]TAX29820.1 hypothetical protein ELI04_08630 [Rhizobium leguminosarum]
MISRGHPNDRPSLSFSRIRLSQFRSFATLDVSLAPEPGVLIVHGSNGLGKSSLFTGLEWALTDQIDHFRDAQGVKKVGNYLTRWRDDATGRSSVTMDFSDGGTIERFIASPDATASVLGGSVQDIVGYLRAPGWTQKISALEQYLLLTHFLGQSALSRLTHRDSAERFDILKEAAQSGEIEAISNILHGKGNTVAARAFARRAEMFDREADEFRKLLDAEASLWIGANDSGVLDDAQALVLSRVISDLLLMAAGHPDTGALFDADANSVGGLAARLLDAKEKLRRESAAVDRARSLVEESRRQHATLVTLQAGLIETNDQLKRAGDALERALRKRDDTARRREEISTRIAHSRNKRDRLLMLRETQAALNDMLVRLRSLNEAHDSAMARLTQARARYENATRREKIMTRVEDEARREAELLSVRRAELERIDQWLDSANSIDAMERALQLSEAANPGIEQQLAQAEADTQALNLSVDAQQRTFAMLQSTYGNLSNAVASIAVHLPSGTCDCPVCETHFDDAADLRSRVAGAAERLAPALFDQEAALAASLRQRDILLRRVAEFQSTQSQLRQQRSTLNETRARAAALLSGIDQTAISLEMRTGVAQSLPKIEWRLGRKVHWLELLRRAAEVLNSSRVALQERDEAQRDVSSTVAEMTDLRIGIEQANADIRGVHASLKITQPNLVDIDAQLLEAGRVLDGDAEEAEAISAELNAVTVTIDSLNASIAAASARRGELARQRAAADVKVLEIRGKWQAMYPAAPEPEEGVLEEETQKQHSRGTLMQEAEDALQRLRAGRNVWATQVAHRDALEALRSAVDAPPNSGREVIRDAATILLSAKKASAASTRETREIARAASIDLFDELDEFNAEYIQPLDFLMKQINQAILCDPRVGIDLQVKKKRIEQIAAKTGEVPNWVGDIDPIFVHSEGQMAALAVSMLCAASLTFPWSRWRSLVLDDPLQHNDAIHAAAFADFMGNLVAEKGYQILLSTHDLGQAEFLKRKFDARKISCATLSLLGSGRGGVEWDLKPAREAKRELANG